MATAPALLGPSNGSTFLNFVGLPTALSSLTEQQVNTIIDVLATIKTVESGNNYTSLTHGTGGASGAYQYEPQTWTAMVQRAIAAGYAPQSATQYSYAAAAPKQIQDAVAAYDVATFLQSVNWNVSEVPLHWYYPAAISNPGLLSYTPPGNSISIGDYQKHWLDVFHTGGGKGGGITGAIAGAISGPIGSGVGTAVGVVSSITKIAEAPAALAAAFLSLLENWRYVLEVLGGVAMMGLGLLIILHDTGQLEKGGKVAAGAALAAA
jgi:hypothetical protein